MKKFKVLLLASLVSVIAACGSETVIKGPTANHDGAYQLALYSDVGDCIADGAELTINVKEGVIVNSTWMGAPVTGLVIGNSVEAFIDAGNGQTVDIEGKFESTLTGTWINEKYHCSGYFEETGRK